jgi:hypothetical protein
LQQDAQIPATIHQGNRRANRHRKLVHHGRQNLQTRAEKNAACKRPATDRFARCAIQATANVFFEEIYVPGAREDLARSNSGDIPLHKHMRKMGSLHNTLTAVLQRFVSKSFHAKGDLGVVVKSVILVILGRHTFDKDRRKT